MKKVLALLLSALMLFGTISISTFAATDYEDLFNNTENEAGLTQNQTILSFDLNGGKISGGVWVYDPAAKGLFRYDTNYIGNTYDMIPNNVKDKDKLTMTPGYEATLPPVSAPSGMIFNGWYCRLDRQTYPANHKYTIPDEAAGNIVQFIAAYTNTSTEEEGMGAAMEILVKVFGTIIGLLFYSNEYGPSATEYGMKIMTDLLSSLFA